MKSLLLKLPEILHKKLRVVAAYTDTTMTQIVIDAIIRDIDEFDEELHYHSLHKEG